MNEIREIRDNLYNAACAVVIKLGVIDLYPNGPDREKAIRDLELAKSNLLVCIGSYDTTRANIINAWQNTRVGANPETYIVDSHKVIEFAYTHMMKFNKF